LNRLRILVWAAAAALCAPASLAGDGYGWAPAGAPGAAERLAGNEYQPSYGTTKPQDEELLVTVNVWGEVVRPGSYDVPDGTNVVTLVSLAGGPTEYANLRRVRLTRPGAPGPMDIDLNSYLKDGDECALAALEPGDTLYVSRNGRYAWTSFIRVVSELAVIAGTAVLYVEVAKGN